MKNLKVVIITATLLILVGCSDNSKHIDTNNVRTINNDANISTNTNSNSGSTSYTAFPYNAPTISPLDKSTYLKAINDARAVEQDCGIYGIMPAVNSLSWNDNLYKASYEHNDDLIASNTFSHNGSGTASDWTATIQELGRKSNILDRVNNNEFNKYGIIGENIYAGKYGDTETLESAIEAWIDSDTHCINLMNKDYSQVGMSKVHSESSDWGTYWTQVFGS